MRSPLALPLSALLLSASASRAVDTPFDQSATTPHQVAVSFDSGPARDALVLITAGPEASAALRRLKAHPAVPPAASHGGTSAEDYYGRLVGAAAGTPDPLFQGYATQAPVFRSVLDTVEAEPKLAALEGKRIASLLPVGTPIAAKLVIVPFFGAAAFSDVSTVKDGATTYLVVDLPRVAGNDLSSTTPPREVVLKLLREATSDAWRQLFEAYVKKPPAWPAEKGPDVDALLARTVAEGPATVFLFPDEFFPIDALLGEPITRAFARWNRVAEDLVEGKRKESARRETLDALSRGDFWNRSAAIVGAEMTDALVRVAGRDAYLKALEKGPRAVTQLYLDLQKSKKLPPLTKTLRRALETPPG